MGGKRMNERIKELAKDAGYYLYDLTETHECKTVETDSTDEWITLEKFAQLIVRECINQAHSVGDLRGANDDMIYGADTAAVKISKHFGVEE